MTAGWRHGLLRWGWQLPPQQRVFASFFLYAFGMGGLYPRMAELQGQMGVAEGALGLALIGASCGTLLSLTFSAPLVARWGHRRTLLGLLLLLPMCYAVAAHAQGPWALFFSLFPAGLCMGTVEIVVNLEADRVEHATGRRIMNRAHAFWSLGFFAAGAVAAGAARLGLSPALQLALVVPLVGVLTLLLLGRFQPAARRHTAATGPALRLARPSRAIMGLVALSLSAMVLEGANIDWSAIYMREVFGSSAATGALAVTLGAGAQALVRYHADPFVERHGPYRVARGLLAVMGAGNLLVALAPFPAAGLLGFALIGVGTSVLFPLAMSAAAQRHDRPAEANVAALAQISFISFLLGPPLLGWVAQQAGLRVAFAVVLPLVLLSLAHCRALRS